MHLIGFVAYSCLIGYLLVERAERGVLPLAAYTFAMAVHFLIVGHSLAEEHGLQHRWSGKWLLALSVLAGCLLGLTTHLSETMFARLFAMLAGGVVITSIGHELPVTARTLFAVLFGRSHFCAGSFCLRNGRRVMHNVSKVMGVLHD